MVAKYVCLTAFNSDNTHISMNGVSGRFDSFEI